MQAARGTCECIWLLCWRCWVLEVYKGAAEKQRLLMSLCSGRQGQVVHKAAALVQLLRGRADHLDLLHANKPNWLSSIRRGRRQFLLSINAQIHAASAWSCLLLATLHVTSYGKNTACTQPPVM